MRQSEQRKRAAGLCIRCSNPSEGRSRCAECRKKESERRRQVVAMRKLVGLCRLCNRPAVSGRRVCKRHAGASGESTERKTKMYKARREAGLCVDCGVDAEGGVRCAKCLERMREYKQKCRDRWRSEGRCSCCSLPAEDHAAQCRKCLARKKEQYERKKLNQQEQPREGSEETGRSSRADQTA